MKGHIRQRGEKSWAIVLDLGRDAEGKRRQKWHTVRGRKKDAERELARLLHEINTGAYVEPSRMTLSDYLDRWLEDYARPNVSGMYISSAFGGGTTNVPGVVARATYSYACTPSHSSDANASTRSSRRF